ncbi:MAG: hypothetical protein WC332_00560 [Clostridia bacterium]|jgi:hypothetical protein
MNKPDKEIVRAIIGLRENTQFKTIVKWLNDSLISQSISNNKNRGEATIICQGRNLEIADILNHISKAHEYLNNENQSSNMEE